MVQDRRGPNAESAWLSSCPGLPRAAGSWALSYTPFPGDGARTAPDPGETCVMWAACHTPNLAAPSLQVATWTWKARWRGRRWRPMA